MAKAVRSILGIERRRERDRQKKREVHARRRSQAIERLGGHCVDCGCSDLALLQFDHVDRKTKLFPVSTPPNEKRFWEELAKCVLRCDKCHRKKSIMEHSGDNHPLAKLTGYQVEEIRLRLAGGESGNALAREFHVGPMQISRIKNGKRWKQCA